MVQMTAAAISFGIAAAISLWVHMGIMIGMGALAFVGYVFLRLVIKLILSRSDWLKQSNASTNLKI